MCEELKYGCKRYRNSDLLYEADAQAMYEPITVKQTRFKTINSRKNSSSVTCRCNKKWPTKKGYIHVSNLLLLMSIA